MNTDIVVPSEQEGTRAVVKAWFKKVGDSVRVDEPVVELETDKVAVEIAAVSDGVLSEILIESGAEVEPGTVLGRIVASVASRPDSMAAPSSVPELTERSSRSADNPQLPPGIRRLLQEHNLEPGEVPLRGERLTREDILAEAERRRRPPVADMPGMTRVPHDTMRRRIAEHMSNSLRVAPHVTAVFEADFSAISAHRRAQKDSFASQNANLTFTAYFVAATVAAMKAVPVVNSRWFDDHIEIYDDINVGIGTALGEKGLIVPVIPKAQELSLLEIAQYLTALTEKARAGALSRTDVQGGTFSISNHGVSGSLVATPIIINQPQSAILGVGKLQKRAVVREGAGSDIVEVSPMAYVTLTIDHRVLDAFQTNAWLTKFVETLETWPAA